MKTGWLAAGLLALISTAAIAAGNYLTYPQVGEPSFCASNNPNSPAVGGTTGQGGVANCVQTVPAGPTALTGSELVPADTGAASNAPVQTVTVPMPLIASGAYFDNTGVTNSGNNLGSYLTSATIPNNVNTWILDTTTTVAALSLTFPSSPLNGQILRVSSQKTITAFTPIANILQTITGTLPTALTPSATAAVGYTWLYNGTTSAWERLQ